ncbi:MAG: hypothetical protein HXX19_20205 [Rhodoferax sp.]|nr:hypothetical protein [Rhodoferax sp.]
MPVWQRMGFTSSIGTKMSYAFVPESTEWDVKIEIIYGYHCIRAFVAAPRGFEVLGVIRFGQEYGLLATDCNGGYYRVNGSTVEALDRHVVESSQLKMRGLHQPLHPVLPARPPAHVTVRKRWLVAL